MTETTTGLRIRLKRSLQHTFSQHEKLHEIQAELDSAIEAANVDLVCVWTDRLRAALDAHFRLEQNVLFPMLLELTPESRATIYTLQAEHSLFLEELEALRPSAARIESDRRSLLEIRKRLAAHESLEENIFSQGLASV